MSSRVWWTTVALVVLSVFVAVPQADGEVVRLKDGRMLQGEIDASKTTDDAVVIALYRDGAVIRVLWDRVLGRDARRLREDLGLEVVEGDTYLMDGHELMLGNGETMRGLVVEVEGGRPEVIYLKTSEGGDRPQEVPRSLVIKTIEIELPVLDVYTVDEAVAEKMKEVLGEERTIDQLTGAEVAAVANYCYKLGAYERAKELFESLLEREDFAEKTMVANKLKNLGELIKAKDAGKMVAEIRRKAFLKRFKEALEIVKEFRENYGDLEQVVALHRIDSIEKRLNIALKEQRIQKVSAEWFRIMSRKVGEHVRMKDQDGEPVSLKEAMSWATKDLTREILADLAAKMELEEEQILELWKARKAKAHTATYGYGSFAAPEEAARIRARKKEATKDLSREEIRRRLQQAAQRRQQAQNKKQKPPKTPDQWWEKAPSSSKRNWLTAFYVEHGDAQFEIIRVYWESCGTCAGKGYKIHNIAQSGDGDGQEKVRCETCNGHGNVRMVRYK
jgi:hypothetical protein